MKIAVLLKSVPDTAAILVIGDDRKSVVMDSLRFIMNPFDEYALEEAVKLKESVGGEVIIISMGSDRSKSIIRAGLAVGADTAILVKVPPSRGLTSKGVATVLAAAVKKVSPDIIFAGKQAVDGDSAQIPERVAELLDMPHASMVTRFQLNDDRVTVDREIEGGHYTLELSLPALFTTQKGINVPRYPTLPATLKAKNKEINELSLADLSLHFDEIEPGLTVDSMCLATQTRKMVILEGDTVSRVKKLVFKMNEEKIAF